MPEAASETAKKIESGFKLGKGVSAVDDRRRVVPDRLQSVQNTLDNLYQQQAAAKEEAGKPFPQEAELKAKSARLAELDAELNLDRPKEPPKEKKPPEPER